MSDWGHLSMKSTDLYDEPNPHLHEHFYDSLEQYSPCCCLAPYFLINAGWYIPSAIILGFNGLIAFAMHTMSSQEHVL